MLISPLNDKNSKRIKADKTQNITNNFWQVRTQLLKFSEMFCNR